MARDNLATVATLWVGLVVAIITLVAGASIEDRKSVRCTQQCAEQGFDIGELRKRSCYCGNLLQIRERER